MIRENHPFDQGYWRRYDRKPPPPDAKGYATMRDGWYACDAEMQFELEEKIAALSAAGQRHNEGGG